MAIGVFDSGIGGLSIARALTQLRPESDLIYLGDSQNAPYGDRSGEDIVALTQSACTRLFEEDACLIILGCNTASAVALRRLQTQWLNEFRQSAGRPINILGIIVPTIEAATGLPWEHESERRGPKIEKLDVVGVFSTVATARSRVYEIEIDKRRQDIAVFSEACSGLADMIERNAPREDLRAKINGHVQSLKLRIGRYPDRAILGCTHYEIVADLFKEALPDNTPLIHQPKAVAQALNSYLDRHKEFDPGSSSLRRFTTTLSDQAKKAQMQLKAQEFWKGSLEFETIAPLA
jgi:glutamate racemase